MKLKMQCYFARLFYCVLYWNWNLINMHLIQLAEDFEILFSQKLMLSEEIWMSKSIQSYSDYKKLVCNW